MNYVDGQEVRLGDKVKLSDGEEGIVVCSIDTNEYSEAYPEKDWGYLKKGAMINFQKYGLIHYADSDSDIYLIARSEA
jgi:hypothetical protein